MSKKIQLIIGSTRENRLGESIVTWVRQQVDKSTDISLEVVDLKQENLPAFDAPVPPAYMPVASEAGRAWAKKVGSADGFIFLTPEYNRSIPSSLKNALDYLVAEWKEKPAVIVSYGYVDGGKGATDHLKDVLDWLKVDTAATTINLHLDQKMMDENGRIQDMEKAFAQYKEQFNVALAHLAEEKTLAAAKV